MTDCIDLLLSRASCRSFSDQPVPDDTLDTLLRAGIQAPTGGNLQPYSIIVIRQQETKDRLTDLCGNQPFIAAAPVNLLFCIDWHRMQRWARLQTAPFAATSSFRHFWISFQDTVMCAQQICTAADALGLGSVYIGTILECIPELTQMLNLPAGVFPVVLLCLGYPDTELSTRPRLPLSTVVHSEQYQPPTDDDLNEAYAAKYKDITVPLNADTLGRLTEVARTIHGDDYARKCRLRAERDGRINPAQRYFGLHYRADKTASGNDRYVQLLHEAGFNFLADPELPLPVD